MVISSLFVGVVLAGGALAGDAFSSTPAPVAAPLAAPVAAPVATPAPSEEAPGAGRSWVDGSTRPGRRTASRMLRRRGDLAITVGPLTPDARHRADLHTGLGVVVKHVVPASAAEHAGLVEGAVVLAVDDVPVDDLPGYLAVLDRRRAGDVPVVTWSDAGDVRSAPIPLQPLPLEQIAGLRVRYGAVATELGRLRTIVTAPETRGPHPAVLLVQDASCRSIDAPFGNATPYHALLEALSRAGFVTMRVEKSGVGDSEGPRCEALDLHSEARHFAAALDALLTDPWVDADAVFVLGHGVGGLLAAQIAADAPVRGVLVSGTHARGWREAIERAAERRWSGTGHSAREVARELADLDAALAGTASLDDALARHPHVRSALGPVLDRSPGYVHDLVELDVAAIWTHVGAPVLALVGDDDAFASDVDQREIVDLVNRAAPGTAAWTSLPDTDHDLARTTPSADAGAIDPRVPARLAAWMRDVIDRPR